MGPKNISTEQRREVGRLFDAAVSSRHEGDFEKAKAACQQALELVDGTEPRLLAVVHGELGYIYRQMREWSLAVKHYMSSVKAAPQSQLASLGLFHSLVELGYWERGLAEIVRFVSLRDSAEYRELLSQGFRDDLPEGARVLAERAWILLEQHLDS